MTSHHVFRAACSCALGLLVTTTAQSAVISWSQHADFTGTSTPTSTFRSLRGLALSDDETKIYGGFIQGTSSSAAKRIDVASTLVDGSATIASSRQPKAIATDDRGNIFVSATDPAGSGQFRVYSADLSTTTATVNPSGTQRIGGMSVWKNGSTYYLYVAREANSSAFIERYVVTNIGSIALDAGFGTAGRFDVRSIDPTALNLTGLEVASDGTIYATDRDIDSLFKISADLTTSQQITVSRAMDVALYDGNLFVSQYAEENSAIAVLKQSDLSSLGALTTGFAHDAISDSGYSGIDVTADGRLFVADQLYNQSPTVSPTTFKDRILVSTPVPEPASGALLIGGAFALLLRRRKD